MIVISVQQHYYNCEASSLDWYQSFCCPSKSALLGESKEIPAVIMKEVSIVYVQSEIEAM